VRYYVLLDGDTPVSLLRRIPGPDGTTVAQALRRDLRWQATDRFRTTARNGEYDIEEISAGRAEAIIQSWRAGR
jgi:hypothetical protein